MAKSTEAPSPDKSRTYLICGVLVGVVVLTTALLVFNWGKIWSDDYSVSEEAPFAVDLGISLDPNAPRPTFDMLPSDIYLTHPNAHDYQANELFPDQVSLSYEYTPREAQTPDRTDESPIGETNRLRQDFIEEDFRIGFVEGSTFTSIKPRGRRGATAKAAAAIDGALDWLAAHQLSDGSWSFDHRGGACNGRCKGQGALRSNQKAATGLVLLALIRSGHSRPDRKHFAAVQKGLWHLAATQFTSAADMPSWEESSSFELSYSHAIATAAMCEGYSATLEAEQWLNTSEEARRWKFAQYSNVHVSSSRWRIAAHRAVYSILQSQQDDGGWTNRAKKSSDATLTSMMLMALWSGHRAGFEVPSTTTQDANRFFVTTSSRKNKPWYFRTAEQFQSESAAKSPTAMVWLCRVATGASPDNPKVIAAAEQLANWGPAVGDAPDLIYDYFATEVLHRVGGKRWNQWCPKIRDHLVSTQDRDKDEHTLGSWFFSNDPGSQLGGRTYCTAAGVLTLAIFCGPTAGNHPPPPNQ